MFLNNFLTLNLISSLFSIISILIGVAFLTILERKILGYIQLRKGPNKMGFKGLAQPFNDAIKLFTKENFPNKNTNFMIFFMAPMFSLLIILSLWMLMPLTNFSFSMNLSFLFFFAWMSMNIYCTMFAGWASNSNYSLIGSIRSISQTISYEISFIIIIFCLIILTENFSISSFFLYQNLMWFIITLFPLYLMNLISSLAELNRSPFDLIEGESELVSGFNTEYKSGSFALIFLSEYASIMFMSMLLTIMFTGTKIYSPLFTLIFSLHCLLIIWIRGALPRMRYDELMYLCWKKFLPISINFFIFLIGFKSMFLN